MALALLGAWGVLLGIEVRGADGPDRGEACRSLLLRVGGRVGLDASDRSRLEWNCERPEFLRELEESGTQACLVTLSDSVSALRAEKPRLAEKSQFFDVTAFCMGGRDAPARRRDMTQPAFLECSRRLISQDLEGEALPYIQGEFYRCRESAVQRAVSERPDAVFACFGQTRSLLRDALGVVSREQRALDLFCSAPERLPLLARPELGPCVRSLKRFVDQRPLELIDTCMRVPDLSGFSEPLFEACVRGFELRVGSVSPAVARACALPAFARRSRTEEFQACVRAEWEEVQAWIPALATAESAGGDSISLASFFGHSYEGCGSEVVSRCFERLAHHCSSLEERAALCRERRERTLSSWLRFTSARTRSWLQGRGCASDSPSSCSESR